MREQSKNIGINVSIWVDRTNESQPIVRIGLRDMASMTVNEAVVLCSDLQKALQVAYDFQRDINREKTKNISIEYLVEKGWTVKDMNTEEIKVKSPNHWIAVSPLITIEKKYGIDSLPAIYAGVSPLEAYRNICLWAADTGVDL